MIGIKYTPILILLAVSGLALLYFLCLCQHKYSIVASDKVGDMLRYRKFSKRVIVQRSKYRKVHVCLALVVIGSIFMGMMRY